MEENNDIDFLGTFIKFHRFVFKNAVPIIIFCVIGAGVGLIRHKVIDDTFRGDFVVLDGGCPKYLLKESMQNVEYGIAESTQEVVPEILNSVYEVQMDTNFQESVKITVYITEDSLPDLELETAIAGLLIYNKTLSGYMQDLRGDIDRQLKRMQSDLTAIKQIQQKIINAEGDLSGMIGLQATSKDVVKLNNEIGKLERQLDRIGNYTVVRPMGKVESLKHGVVTELVFGTLAGFFIGLLLCAYVGILRKVRVQS